MTNYPTGNNVGPHVAGCSMRLFGHTDAAKRVSDHATQTWMDHGWPGCKKWMAFALADGAPDKALYDRKPDAIRHQRDEFLCMYLPLHPGGMNPCEAEIMLRIHRQAYDNGFRLTDPDAKDGGKDVIVRQSPEQAQRQLGYLVNPGAFRANR